jgi:uncharacterized membrane protein
VNLVDRYLRLRAKDQHLHPVGRLELFGDGILAIAATLLVLTLTVPAHAGRSGTRHALWTQRFTFVAILIGFFEIGGSWLMSRRLARLVTEVDHWVTLIWMAAIFTATLIPFTTLVLARSLDGGDVGFGVLCVASVTWVALALSLAAIVYVRWRGLLRPEAEAIYRPYLQLVAVGLAVWTIAVPLSLVLPWVAFAIVILGYTLGLCPLPTEGADAPDDPEVVLDD